MRNKLVLSYLYYINSHKYPGHNKKKKKKQKKNQKKRRRDILNKNYTHTHTVSIYRIDEM